MNIKAVLFDVDDTLFDRELAQKKILEMIVNQFPQVFGSFEKHRLMEAWQESDLLAAEGFEAGAVPPTIRNIRSRQFLRLLGIREDLEGVITEAFLRDYPSINSPVEGAVKLVKELSRRFKVGVISNSLPDTQYRKLETLGLRDLFSCIVLSEEFGIRKPDPGIFLHAAGLLQTPPSECLFVGDSFSSDIVGARAAGMTACWFRRGKTPLSDRNVSADFEIDKLEELPGLLRKNKLLL